MSPPELQAYPNAGMQGTCQTSAGSGDLVGFLTLLLIITISWGWPRTVNPEAVPVEFQVQL